MLYEDIQRKIGLVKQDVLATSLVQRISSENETKRHENAKLQELLAEKVPSATKFHPRLLQNAKVKSEKRHLQPLQNYDDPLILKQSAGLDIIHSSDGLKDILNKALECVNTSTTKNHLLPKANHSRRVSSLAQKNLKQSKITFGSSIMELSPCSTSTINSTKLPTNLLESPISTPHNCEFSELNASSVSARSIDQTTEERTQGEVELRPKSSELSIVSEIESGTKPRQYNQFEIEKKSMERLQRCVNKLERDKKMVATLVRAGAETKVEQFSRKKKLAEWKAKQKQKCEELEQAQEVFHNSNEKREKWQKQVEIWTNLYQGQVEKRHSIVGIDEQLLLFDIRRWQEMIEQIRKEFAIFRAKHSSCSLGHATEEPKVVHAQVENVLCLPISTWELPIWNPLHAYLVQRPEQVFAQRMSEKRLLIILSEILQKKEESDIANDLDQLARIHMPHFVCYYMGSRLRLQPLIHSSLFTVVHSVVEFLSHLDKSYLLVLDQVTADHSCWLLLCGLLCGLIRSDLWQPRMCDFFLNALGLCLSPSQFRQAFQKPTDFFVSIEDAKNIVQQVFPSYRLRFAINQLQLGEDLLEQLIIGIEQLCSQHPSGIKIDHLMYLLFHSWIKQSQRDLLWAKFAFQATAKLKNHEHGLDSLGLLFDDFVRVLKQFLDIAHTSVDLLQRLFHRGIEIQSGLKIPYGFTSQLESEKDRRLTQDGFVSICCIYGITHENKSALNPESVNAQDVFKNDEKDGD